MIRTLVVLVLALAQGALHSAAPAHAGEFQAAPIRVFLEAKARSALVTLRNRGATPVRLQLDARSWDETEEGGVLLAPTDEIVVFPSLVELAAGESLMVRVATTGPRRPGEHTYRLIVEELPAGEGTGGIAIRTRLSLPIFVRGEAGGSPEPRLTSAALDPGARAILLALHNDGDHHFRPRALVVEARGEGDVAFVHRIPGWYVLAGRRRDYRVVLPPTLGCVREIVVALDSDTGALSRRDAVTDPGCDADVSRSRGAPER